MHSPAEADEQGELLEFLYMCPIGVLSLSGDGTVEMLNPHASQLLMSLARGGAIDNLFDALANVAPELRNLTEHFDADSGIICQDHRIHIGTRKPGPRVLACTLMKVSECRLMAVLSDISAAVEQEVRLRQTESWLTTVISDFTDFALCNLDRHGRIVRWSPSMQLRTGYADAEALGQSLQFLYDPREARPDRATEHAEAALREGWHLDEAWARRKDGAPFWCQILIAAQDEEAGACEGFSVVLRDATRGRINCEELRRMVTTDHLTGAANRMHLTGAAAREVVRWQRYGHPMALIILDLDHFKSVNDTHGHRAGDAVLQHVVRVAREALRKADVLARLGGEEFAVLLPETALAEAAEIAERLRQAIAASQAQTQDKLIAVTVSLGCAAISPSMQEFDTLLEAADQALYRAKRGGRNRVELAALGVPAPDPALAEA